MQQRKRTQPYVTRAPCPYSDCRSLNSSSLFFVVGSGRIPGRLWTAGLKPAADSIQLYISTDQAMPPLPKRPARTRTSESAVTDGERLYDFETRLWRP